MHWWDNSRLTPPRGWNKWIKLKMIKLAHVFYSECSFNCHLANKQNQKRTTMDQVLHWQEVTMKNLWFSQTKAHLTSQTTKQKYTSSIYSCWQSCFPVKWSEDRTFDLHPTYSWFLLSRCFHVSYSSPLFVCLVLSKIRMVTSIKPQQGGELSLLEWTDPHKVKVQ